MVESGHEEQRSQVAANITAINDLVGQVTKLQLDVAKQAERLAALKKLLKKQVEGLALGLGGVATTIGILIGRLEKLRESECGLNKFIMVPSQHPDLGTVAADIAETLAEKPVPVFVGSEEDPHAEIKEFTIDEDGLSFELSHALTPESTLRPYLSWGFCEGCESFAIRFVYLRI